MANLNVFQRETRSMLAVSEVFCSVQGEGPLTGVPSLFIRLAGCNLHCDFCDTKYTWRDDLLAADPPRHMTGEQVLAACADARLARPSASIDNVVITGGEPLLHGEHIVDLVRALGLVGYSTFEIETNGLPNLPFRSMALSSEQLWFNVSPKLPLGSGNTVSVENYARALEKFSGFNARYKFVVTDAASLVEIDALVQWANLNPSSVWLMPEGTTAQQQLAAMSSVMDAAYARGYNFTSRLHVLRWGALKGV